MPNLRSVLTAGLANGEDMIAGDMKISDVGER
jgi:hypothetical protein